MGILKLDMSNHYEALTQRPKSVCVLGNVCTKFKCKILRETFCVWSSKMMFVHTFMLAKFSHFDDGIVKASL